MNYYETLYIVHPALEAGRLKDIILSVEPAFTGNASNVVCTQVWGKKKLAYYIDKQKYGTYVLIQYKGEGKCTNDFAVELEHNPNILAYLTTAIESNDVLEIEEDLDTQISGKTRETEKTEPSKPEIITNEKLTKAILISNLLSNAFSATFLSTEVESPSPAAINTNMYNAVIIIGKRAKLHPINVFWLTFIKYLLLH